MDLRFWMLLLSLFSNPEQLLQSIHPSPRSITMPQFASRNLHPRKHPRVSNRQQVRNTDSYLASSTSGSLSEFISFCKRRRHNDRDMRCHKWALSQTSARPASQILPAERETSDASWGFFVEFEDDDDCRSSLDYEGITQSSDFGFKIR